jgi:TetR/AcrR family transcriptional regulator, mexJK operon transcriptional repressor
MGRKVDPAKEVAILAAARAAFLEQPYDRVSVDAIATRAGVSKVTIYSKYQSKDALFVAAINEGCAAIYNKAKADALSEGQLDVALKQLGVDFMSMILAPQMTALHGVMIQVAQHKPEITEQYFQVVVEGSIVTLADTLTIAVERKSISCCDTRRAAIQFIAMIQGIYRYEHELGVANSFNMDELQTYIGACVDMFLRGHSWTG